MKYFLIILFYCFILSSCNQKDHSDHREYRDNKKTSSVNNSFPELEFMTIPYCLDIDTLNKSNYYQVNLDTFLTSHQIKKSSNLEINKLFHKNTIDFVSKSSPFYMHYLYNKEAFAIKKLQINNNIFAVFYTYLFNSEISQPRIEIQTFNNDKKNIDNLIISSVFNSECSGFRNFCINKDKIIEIKDYYYCNDQENGESNDFKNIYYYRIDNNGKFIHVK